MSFIVFEGPDGSGKDTVADIVSRFLSSIEGHPTIHQLRDPGSTELGERLRKWLKDGGKATGLRTQLLGFLTARVAMLEQMLECPATDVWLCRRFDLSTLVYQGCQLPEGREYVSRMNSLALCGLPAPDLYVILVASDEVLDQRIACRNNLALPGQDRFEMQQRAQVLAWREAYRRFNGYGLYECGSLFVSYMKYGCIAEESPWDVTEAVLPSIAAALWIKDTPWKEAWKDFRRDYA
jgi:dTMP kinase